MLETGDTAWKKYSGLPREGLVVTCFHAHGMTPLGSTLASCLASDPALHMVLMWVPAFLPALLPYLWLLVQPRISSLWVESSVLQLSAFSPSASLLWPAVTLWTANGSWNHLWMLVAPLSPCPLLPVHCQHKWGKHNAHTHTKSCFILLFRGTETTIHHLP